ncbi:MAG: hypothetical protein GXP39_18110 [Chloroflexi bacterium]|nr:hypothetical protein [Chloroflexota bacterium]
MRRILWLLLIILAGAWSVTACNPEDVSDLLTAVPTLTAPTPSATLGPPIIIDARVRDVSTIMSVIAIYPSQGFEQIVVRPGATIVGLGGHPMDLTQIHSGDIITVYGPPVGDGSALLAIRIAVRPAYVSQTEGQPVEPAEQVIARFFQAMDRGRIDQALRLISPVARIQQGEDVWEARLRAVQSIRLLSVARVNQAAWTDHWQEYLVTARVVAEEGGDWEPGVSRRYVAVVRGTSGPWLILDIRREPGTPVQMTRLEGTLMRVDRQRRVLTVQPKDRAPVEIALSEHTQVVTEDGWSLWLDELKPGVLLAVEGLPAGDRGFLPDRVTVFGLPGQPSVSLNPSEGTVGQTIRVVGRNWPPGAELRIYVTVPTATFQPKPVAGGVVDENGHFDVALTIPTRWPDGVPVTEEVLNVVVSTADFTAKARTQFHVVKPE